MNNSVTSINSSLNKLMISFFTFTITKNSFEYYITFTTITIVTRLKINIILNGTTMFITYNNILKSIRNIKSSFGYITSIKSKNFFNSITNIFFVYLPNLLIRASSVSSVIEPIIVLGYIGNTVLSESV